MSDQTQDSHPKEAFLPTGLTGLWSGLMERAYGDTHFASLLAVPLELQLIVLFYQIALRT